MKVTAEEIRKMTVEEVKKEIATQGLELRKVAEAIRGGKEKNVSKNLNMKRNIARMLTVLRQKQSV